MTTEQRRDIEKFLDDKLILDLKSACGDCYEKYLVKESKEEEELDYAGDVDMSPIEGE